MTFNKYFDEHLSCYYNNFIWCWLQAAMRVLYELDYFIRDYNKINCASL